MAIKPQEMLREDLEVGTALISVYDKTGLIDFAKELAKRRVTIIATGGTYKALSEAGIDVIPVTAFTSFPEMLDGRVKTLQPQIFGGILANKANPEHMSEIRHHGVRPIDMVVVNFYPFEKVAENPDATDIELLENIDIGGPSQVRAAAKNHGSVCVVTSPQQYDGIIAEMQERNGKISLNTRKMLSQAAFTTLARDAVEVASRLGQTAEANPAPKSKVTN